MMVVTYYGLEQTARGRKKPVLHTEQVPGEKVARTYDRVAFIENARLLRFGSDTTLKAWVAQDPKHRRRVTMRELEEMFSTAHKTMARIAEDGEKEYSHIGGVAYTEHVDENGENHFCAVGVPDRYGIVRQSGEDVARRVYAEHYGAIPAGKSINQTCGIRSCVRPSHLAVVDRPARNSAVVRKLTPEQVNEIRRLLDENRPPSRDPADRHKREPGKLRNSDIASMFHISESMVSRIDLRHRKGAVA